MGMHKYTREEKDFLKAFIPGHSYREIAEAFNREFQTDVTASQIKNFIGNHKLNTGRTGRFPKGHEPANKGMPVSPEMREKVKATWFRKGQQPATTDPIGTEKRLGDGYIWVKVDNQPKASKKVNWKQKHRLIWEEVHGPIPEGHVLLFLDGDPTHVTLENLALVSRAELARMNQNHLIHDQKELTEAGVAIAKVLVKMGEVNRRNRNESKMNHD